MADKATSNNPPSLIRPFQAMAIFCACAAAIFALLFLPAIFLWPPWIDMLAGLLFSGLLTCCTLRLLGRAAETSRQTEALRTELERRVDERTLQLEEALRRAEAANLSKSEFLAVMSHELRTPLTAILGFSEILLRRPSEKPPEKTREYLEHIHESGRKLLALIDDILNLNETGGETDEPHIASVDLRELIERVSRPFTKSLEGKGLRLAVRIEGGLREAETDGQKLKKILGSLLSNAIKFSPQGGKITVSVRPAEEGRAFEISVSDHGIGIPGEHLEKIFEPFTQVDASFSRRYGGMGLGLARSSQLAERLGGRLHVESIPGEGSTFIATLPCMKPKAHVPESPAISTADRFVGNVLVAEDDLVNLKLIQAMLETLGCKVDTVLDGREAVEAFLLNDYDLILMDCRMPGMDGYEATREIRTGERMRRRRHTPIIALTAHVLDEARKRCAEAGMEGFLGKPFDQDQLARVLGHWLSPEKSLRPDASEGSRISLPDEDPSFPGIASLDRRFLDRIRAIQDRGNPRLLETVIELYLRETPKLMKLLRDASDRSDASGMRQAAHTLRSSSANLGATRLAKICEEVETLARSEEMSKARPLVARLETEYPLVHTALEAEI